MSSSKPFDSISPPDSFELDGNLTLVPRVKLILTVHPLNPSHTKPIDDWQLKHALLDFLSHSLSPPLSVPDSDLDLTRIKDLKKRKRGDPIASGTLIIRDLGFLKQKKRNNNDEEEDDEVRVLEKKFVEWRKYLVEKLDGIELSLGGVKFRLSVELPVSDDFEGMRKEWEEFYAFGNRGHSRGGNQEPDTIVLRGVPSRWFAEPRVSSKPSMLVTHTIFSTFGNIRNINVTEDDEFGQEANEDTDGLVSGLHCKIVVQFDKHRDFYNALKMLCGRSLQKQGSRFIAEYKVSWDKDGLFRNIRGQAQDKGSRMVSLGPGQYRSEASRPSSRYSPDRSRPKRFRE